MVDNTMPKMFIVTWFNSLIEKETDGFMVLHSSQKDEALIAYGEAVGKHGDDHVVRLVEIPYGEEIEGFDGDVFQLLFNDPNLINMINIEFPALFNHIPDDMETLDRLPRECRNRYNVENVIARNYSAEKIIPQYVDEEDAEIIIDLVNVMLDLCDGFFDLDGYETLEYVRGQAEMIANHPKVATDDENIREAIRVLLRNRSTLTPEQIEEII